MTERCKKCWCPNNLGHNQGCPDHPDAKPTDQKDYDRGWSNGFADISDQPQRLTKNKAYDFGFRNGKAEIDQLADDAAQSRCFS